MRRRWGTCPVALGEAMPAGTASRRPAACIVGPLERPARKSHAGRRPAVRAAR